MTIFQDFLIYVIFLVLIGEKKDTLILPNMNKNKEEKKMK